MSNPAVQTPITVTHQEDNHIDVQPAQLAVSEASGVTVIVLWQPGEDTEITAIYGFPTSVAVNGPDLEGKWTATYHAVGNVANWSYLVTTRRLDHHAVRHDPEIDNTPPPQV